MSSAEPHARERRERSRPSISNGGTIYPQSSGTITTHNLYGGTADFSPGIPRTVTTLNQHARTTSEPIYDPAVLTITNHGTPERAVRRTLTNDMSEPIVALTIEVFEKLKGITNAWPKAPAIRRQSGRVGAGVVGRLVLRYLLPRLMRTLRRR